MWSVNISDWKDWKEVDLFWVLVESWKDMVAWIQNDSDSLPEIVVWDDQIDFLEDFPFGDDQSHRKANQFGEDTMKYD